MGKPMFTAEQSRKMDEPEKILAIIKEVEVWRLANFDGCICSHFSVRNVNVEISCGKGGERGVFVSGHALDYYWKEGTPDDNDENRLRPIAEEVVRQSETDGRGPLPIFYKPRFISEQQKNRPPP